MQADTNDTTHLRPTQYLVIVVIVVRGGAAPAYVTCGAGARLINSSLPDLSNSPSSSPFLPSFLQKIPRISASPASINHHV